MNSLQMWRRDDFEKIGDWRKLRESEMLSVTKIAPDEHFLIRVDAVRSTLSLVVWNVHSQHHFAMQ